MAVEEVGDSVFAMLGEALGIDGALVDADGGGTVSLTAEEAGGTVAAVVLGGVAACTGALGTLCA